MNWGRWIIERLPERLRTVTLFTLCMVYTVFIRRRHNEFLEWQKRMKTRMSGSPQVCMLKKVIYDELGIYIEIEEGNGKPYDFIITTAFSDVDKERQLFALLDRYKLAGKSYGYANAEVAIEYEWGGYVCEVQMSFVEWGGFVCEHKYRPINHIYIRFNGTQYSVTPEFAITTDMTIEIYAYRWDGVVDLATYAVMYKGNKDTIYKNFPYIYGKDDVRIHQKVEEDETYIYKIEVI